MPRVPTEHLWAVWLGCPPGWTFLCLQSCAYTCASPIFPHVWSAARVSVLTRIFWSPLTDDTGRRWFWACVRSGLNCSGFAWNINSPLESDQKCLIPLDSIMVTVVTHLLFYHVVISHSLRGAPCWPEHYLTIDMYGLLLSKTSPGLKWYHLFWSFSWNSL